MPGQHTQRQPSPTSKPSTLCTHPAVLIPCLPAPLATLHHTPTHTPHVATKAQTMRATAPPATSHCKSNSVLSNLSSTMSSSSSSSSVRPAARRIVTHAAATETLASETPITARNNAPSDTARQVLFGVAPEQTSEVEAQVTGTLPPWLSGSLLVNGGGDYARMKHMFDGYACLTKVRVSGGKAWGRQRYLDTEAYRTYKQMGKVVFREFATPPETSGALGKLQNVVAQLFGLMTGNPKYTDNASVNLAAVDAAAATRRAAAGGGGGQLLLAMSETPTANYLIDPEDLSTVEQVQYTDGVPGDLTTAHPSVMRDGSLINFTRSLPNGGFHIIRQDPHTLKRTELGFVADRHPMSPAWVHDFAATDKYAVIIEHPLYMNLGSLLLDTPATHIFMNWKPEDEVKVHVVSLDGSKTVRSFTCPTFFFFHVGNAYESEDGSCLHVDIAAYDDPQILLDLDLAPLKRPAVDAAGALQQQVSRSSYRRLTIPLNGQGGDRLQAPQPLLQAEAHGHFCEFPAVNPAQRGHPYRYSYCLSAVRPTNMGNALSKLDLQTGQVQTWHGPGGAIGEPAFIARPGGSAEDDGVVLAPGVDAQGRGFMLVLDAASWTQAALVQLPFGVPNRFHGMWLPDAN